MKTPDTFLYSVDPAAGSEISVVVPEGETWDLLALASRLATDATAATRRVMIEIDDGVNTFYRHASGAVHNASESWRYNFAAGLGYEKTSMLISGITIGIPRLTLPPGYRIRTITEALQAGDNWEAPVLSVVRWG